MDLIIEKSMHLGQVGSVAFHSVDAHLPVPALVTARVPLCFEDIRVFAKEMSPLPKTDTDIQNRARFQLAQQVNYDRDGIGAAAGHEKGPSRFLVISEQKPPGVRCPKDTRSSRAGGHEIGNSVPTTRTRATPRRDRPRPRTATVPIPQ